MSVTPAAVPHTDTFSLLMFDGNTVEHLLYWSGPSPEGIQLTHTYLLMHLLHLYHLLDPVQV